ncbi:hypothetical protein CEQ90_17225 [Lewinellaceae bacterium SD302]|nr:hypothetical protein CEQ90_17225 [Lewinellaceae bacterium SD302]
MVLGTSYRDISRVSLPIIVGSAAQNVIALTDSVFLYYRSEEDFAAIGFVATFYIIVAAIGFGFSRGGQILIARKAGAKDYAAAGRSFYSTLYFELALAGVMFLFMTFGIYWLFAALVDSDDIFYRSLEYMSTRKYGVFASYVGVALVAMYTGIARPNFIVFVTLLLAAINIVLNRALIFGEWGFPEMGIAGAGLASTIAEYISTAVFLVYMVFDRKNRIYQLFRLPPWDRKIIRQIVKVSVPIVAMSVVGLGSSFVFFGLIENFGEKALAEANLVRIAYLILAIPCWGFSSGTNTIISYFVGRGRFKAIIPLLWKTSYLCLAITVAMALPLLLFPNEVLYPLLGDERAYLIDAAYPTLVVLFGILIVFTFGSIFFNGLIGIGATTKAMRIQVAASLGYTSLIFLVVYSSWGSLPLAWGMEIIYWSVIFFFTFRLLKKQV